MSYEIDLFCGAGGMSEGIIQAGFHILFSSASRRKYVEYIVPDICVRGASAKRRRSGRYD